MKAPLQLEGKILLKELLSKYLTHNIQSNSIPSAQLNKYNKTTLKPWRWRYEAFWGIPLYVLEFRFRRIHKALHTIYCIQHMQYDLTSISTWMLKVGTFRRLDKLSVMRSRHFLLQLGQYILHGVLPLPICKKTKFLGFNLFHLQVYESCHR